MYIFDVMLYVHVYIWISIGWNKEENIRLRNVHREYVDMNVIFQKLYVIK